MRVWEKLSTNNEAIESFQKVNQKFIIDIDNSYVYTSSVKKKQKG